MFVAMLGAVSTVKRDDHEVLGLDLLSTSYLQWRCLWSCGVCQQGRNPIS
jgi:hypothetical protein